jgi:hypothetical protein
MVFVAGRPVKQAYARGHGHNYLVARGISILGREDKKRILADCAGLYASRNEKYEKLLVLDPDATIGNVDVVFVTFGSFRESLLLMKSGNLTNLLGCQEWSAASRLLR